MPIHFTCPHCGNTTDVANQYAGVSNCHPAVVNALFCDGWARSLLKEIAPKTLEALATIDGGETVDMDDL